MEDPKIPAIFVVILSLAASCVSSEHHRGNLGNGQPATQQSPTVGPYPTGGYPPQPSPTYSGGQVTPYVTPVPTFAPTGTVQTPANPNLIEFRIPAGTGRGPWNTKAQPLVIQLPPDVARKPVTLRIINDDSTPHLLHTNGVPCPHQDISRPTPPGGSHDCPIRAAFDSTASGVLYDHNFGESAWFYVRATK